jgi:hypothetical protein
MKMIGKLVGGLVGRKVAQRYGDSGFTGAVIGAGVGAVARRGLGPLGLLIGAGYVASKVMARRRGTSPRV